MKRKATNYQAGIIKIVLKVNVIILSCGNWNNYAQIFFNFFFFFWLCWVLVAACWIFFVVVHGLFLAVRGLLSSCGV